MKFPALQKAPPWREMWICGLLCAATYAVFSPLTQADFILYDDPGYVSANLHVTSGLSLENVRWAFRSTRGNNWHPLTWVSHMLDVELFGLRPGGHHLTSVLFHAVNALLLFSLLRRLTGALTRSALVAALFALHPLHVESVAWIAERKDVLSGCFFFLTLWAYTFYAQEVKGAGEPEEGIPKLQRASPPPHVGGYKAGGPQEGTPKLQRPIPAIRRRVAYGATLLCFALGLMSKPMLVTLPFILLLLDFWPLRRIRASRPKAQTSEFARDNPASEPRSQDHARRSTAEALDHSRSSMSRLLVEKIPFFTLSLVSCLVTFFVQRQTHAVAQALPFGVRLANAPVAYVKYLAKTLWPTDLAVFYPHPGLEGGGGAQWSAWQVGGAVFLLAGVCIWSVSSLRRRPWFFTGWFWYLGALVPVIGIVQAGSQAMADRYTYLPLIGIFLAAVWGGAELVARRSVAVRTGVACAAVAAIAVGAGVAWRQAAYWRNTQTLFEHAVAATGQNALTETVLGAEFFAQGKPEQALAHLKQALAIAPGWAPAHHNLGTVLESAGKTKEAVEALETAARLQPWYDLTHSRLAVLLWKLDQGEQALDHCLEALRLNPENLEARIALGGMFWRAGQRREAIEQYQRAVRLYPNEPVARYNLGFAWAAQQRPVEAIAELEEALRLRPDYVEAVIELGRVLTAQGRLAEAQAQFRQALRVSPTNATLFVSLGNVLHASGLTNQAAAAFAEAVRLEPRMVANLVQAAHSLVTRGHLETALARLHTAFLLKPDDPDIHLELASILVRQNRRDEAALQYRQVLQLRPDSAEALSGLAWILATHPRAEARNGSEAVRLAERACELGGVAQARLFAALDVAYGEAGRFADAIGAAEKTKSLALAAGQTNVAQAAAARIALYQQGQAYHQ